VVAGEGKATAVAMSLSGAGRVQVPAAGVSGTRATLWLLDEAAAKDLPRALRRG
jgi:6-phosphogluconolactonase